VTDHSTGIRERRKAVNARDPVCAAVWVAGIALAVAGFAGTASRAAAEPAPFALIGGDVQKRANGVLALMGYQLTPDVTTGSLALSNDASGSPDFSMVSLGGGFTFSKDFRLYLEGTAAYARYDPTFVASDGVEQRRIPTRWNSVSGTGGIGWDFPIARDLVVRPIFNFSFGHVESDLAVAERIIERRTGRDIEFLENGRLNALGVGGSVMLDYERYRPENEIDVELRYTNIYLQSTSGTSEAVKGSASAQSASLWSRWRAPTGFTAMERPLRYLLEFAHTQFLGDLRGILGFDSLTSLGAGFELDSSAYNVFVTRTRLVGRFQIGDNVRGWSVGVAVSF
jgi:hypothetical protein